MVRTVKTTRFCLTVQDPDIKKPTGVMPTIVILLSFGGHMSDILETIKARDPHEREFYQAVRKF